MDNPPKTLEEARKTRYNKWGGNPKGTPFREGFCAFEIWTGGRGSLPVQCSKKPGHGPAGLYCRTHAPQVEPLPAITVYATSEYSWDIEENQASRIEGESVWGVDGRRSARVNDFCAYWPSKEAAISHLLMRCDNKISSARREIKEAEEAKEKLLAMRNEP